MTRSPRQPITTDLVSAIGAPPAEWIMKLAAH
jgi:hypothetical protein